MCRLRLMPLAWSPCGEITTVRKVPSRKTRKRLLYFEQEEPGMSRSTVLRLVIHLFSVWLKRWILTVAPLSH